jgi:lipoate-protein ligase A
MMRANALLRCVRTHNTDIARVLRLEEGLLRHRVGEDWLTMCDGASTRGVVLGVSSKLHALVDEAYAKETDARIVRRFTGGGTIACDGDTMFVGMTMGTETARRVGMLPATPKSGGGTFPRDVMRATGLIYERVFDKCGTFAVRENDYVFGDMKFGGNAQAITKERFLHHTSFLYDYDEASMRRLLKHPERAPEYRMGRSHEKFVTRLKTKGYERLEVFDRVVRVMEEFGFDVEYVDLEQAEEMVERAVAESGVKRWDNTKIIV